MDANAMMKSDLEQKSTQMETRDRGHRPQWAAPPSGCPPQGKFEFELATENNKYAHPWVGYCVLGLSVIGGSSLGVISNFVSAQGPILKNTWRFQALIFVFILLLPFFLLYDRFYLRTERYRAYLRDMKAWGIQLKKDESLGAQLKKLDQEVSGKRAYEDKYPRGSYGSEQCGVDTAENFREFKKADQGHLRATAKECERSVNQTMQVVMRNNLALLDFKGLIGRRTFTKNVYFIT